jgi:hypothetical protein
MPQVVSSLDLILTSDTNYFTVPKIVLDQAGIIDFPLLKPGFTQRSEQSDAKDYVRTQCMRLLGALSINKFITEMPGHQEKPRELASL